MNLEELINEEDPYSVFGERTRQFSGEASRERATFFCDQQKTYWIQLAETFADPNNSSQQIINILMTALQQGQLFGLMAEGNVHVVHGKIPLLDQRRVSTLRAHLNAKKFAAIVLVECATLFANQKLAQLLDLELFMLAVSYLNGGSSPSEIRSHAKQQQFAISQLRSNLEDLVRDQKSQLEAFQGKAKSFLDEKASEVEALKKSVGESIRLESSAALWRTKAIWHQVGFILWFLTFTTTACTLGWYVITHIAQISGAIPKDKDGAITYYSLVFFIVPVLAAGWLLRLLSRFINNQQALLDDAQHRDMMTKTYLALVADKQSGVDEKDRLVMLSAIFRPLPGAQTEEVAPPTILDLLKKD